MDIDILREKFSLEGQTALVTGSGRGVGKGLATALAKAGAEIVVLDIIEENARVEALAAALERDDREALGRLTAASFAGARDLFEISVPAMEAMYEAMHGAPGRVGCRQAGAGFGGCMVAVVEDDRVGEFCRATAERYRRATGLTARIEPVRVAAGAGRLELPAGG